jgi:nucleotide-binding universal stress UspA family protein
MITVRRILCPTDFSEFSSRALAHALPLAKWYEATIAALHVYSFFAPPPTKLPTIAARPHLSTESREEILHDLREFTEPARRAGLLVEHLVVEGDPVDEIVKAAGRADLLVLGTHGRRGFEKLMLGSVAERVLRKSPCPVLTVPRRAPESPPDGSPAFKTIVCPVDFSEESQRALEFALSLAKEADSGLSLLHVVEALPEIGPPDRSCFDLMAYGELVRRIARDRLRALIPEGARQWCRPEAIVASGKAYRCILKVAEERRADLIVMGVTGRGRIDRMLFGSTTAQVVREATCPVLTIRAV